MLSLVSALLPPGTDPRSYTPREQANIETVLKLRSAPFRERQNYMHPAMVRHRWGFASLADVTGMKDGAGYDASTCSDRVDTIEDLIAKDDRVWAVWTMRGTHTGQLFGIPATGQPIEILEAGIWRLVDGLVIEAWFFGDELRLLRQLGVIPDTQLRAAAVSSVPRADMALGSRSAARTDDDGSLRTYRGLSVSARSKCVTLEQGALALDAAHRVVVEDDAADAAVLG
jgi:predicted ester cyclase